MPHSVTSQKKAFFIVTAVKTSNLTSYLQPLSVKFRDWVCRGTKYTFLTNGCCPPQSSPLRSQHIVVSDCESPGCSWWMPHSDWLWAPPSTVATAWIASKFSCRCLVSGVFSRGNIKSHGDRSGEYGGSRSTVTFCLARNPNRMWGTNLALGLRLPKSSFRIWWQLNLNRYSGHRLTWVL
jgi:hypothetical protein